MTSEEFDTIVKQLLLRCEDKLNEKATEYATEDRLHNFRIAAKIQNITMVEALTGMMAKHTISVYDMCKPNTDYTMAQWDEKIVDHINYLILLRAIVNPTTRPSAHPTAQLWKL